MAAVHDPLPREPARSRAQRPALRAGGRDVSRVRNLRLEGRRHGGGRAGAVSRNGKARRRPGELAALLAATGAQTETVPPSLILIAIGSVTGVSIAALFQGGLLPALVVGLMLCALVWCRSRGDRRFASQRATGREIGRAFLIALPALLLPFVIRSAVIEGVATATEVSTIGIAYSFLVGALVYRQFEWSQLGRVLVQTASLSGAILIVVGAATAMAWAITQSGFSQSARRGDQRHAGRTLHFIALSILLFAVLGCVLEGLPAVVLFAPADVPHRQAIRRARGALLDDRHPGDGRRACSRRRSASASTSPAPSAAPIPTRRSVTSGSISRCCWSASSWSPRCHGCRSDFFEVPRAMQNGGDET